MKPFWIITMILALPWIARAEDKGWAVTAMEEKQAKAAEAQKNLAKAQADKILENERQEATKSTQKDDSLSLKPSISPFSDAYNSKYGNSTNMYSAPSYNQHPGTSNTASSTTRPSLTLSPEPGQPYSPSPLTAGTYTNNTTPAITTPSQSYQSKQPTGNNGQLPYKKLSSNPYDIPKGYDTSLNHLTPQPPGNTPLLDQKNATQLDSKSAAAALKKSDEARKMQEESLHRPTIKDLNNRIPNPESNRRF